MEDEKTVIEGQAYEPNPGATETNTNTDSPKAKPAGDTLKGAWKQVENIGQTLGEALQGRGNVVMVRVNDDTLEHLDMLVEAELVKSRSEAAALLISEGMKANQSLFGKIREITDQISQLRTHLRETVQREEQVNNSGTGEE
jgi:hypothetical protein